MNVANLKNEQEATHADLRTSRQAGAPTGAVHGLRKLHAASVGVMPRASQPGRRAAQSTNAGGIVSETTHTARQAQDTFARLIDLGRRELDRSADTEASSEARKAAYDRLCAAARELDKGSSDER